MPWVVGLLLEVLGDALAVGGLVVQHVGGLDALALGELGAHGALHVVPAADAVDFQVAAVGDLGVGVGGGDVAQVGGVVLLGGGDLHAGIVVADDAQHGRVGDDGLGVGHAGVRVALVVEGGQLDLEAHLGEGPGQLLDGELGAVLDVAADDRHGAGERALGGDLDGLVLLLAAGCEQQAERRGRRREDGKEFLHG